MLGWRRGKGYEVADPSLREDFRVDFVQQIFMSPAGSGGSGQEALSPPVEGTESKTPRSVRRGASEPGKPEQIKVSCSSALVGGTSLWPVLAGSVGGDPVLPRARWWRFKGWAWHKTGKTSLSDRLYSMSILSYPGQAKPSLNGHENTHYGPSPPPFLCAIQLGI